MPNRSPSHRSGRRAAAAPRLRRLGGWLVLTAVVTAACGGTPAAPAGPPAPLPSLTAEADGDVRIVAVGDIACAPGEAVTSVTCQQAETARLTSSLDPDAVIALGDLQYESGSAADFQESFAATWGALRARTRTVPGNHEYMTSGAEGYFDSVEATDPWYVWEAGAWRVYLLNSNCDDIDCAAERAWLEDELTANPRQCTLMAMHHPRYSSGAHHSDEAMTDFWQIAYDHHVDLALAGHDHDYERFAAMDAQGNLSPGRGITSFVAGTGGKSLYTKKGEVAGSAFFQSTDFGVLELTLGNTAFSWRYLTTDGEVLDPGTAPCI